LTNLLRIALLLSYRTSRQSLSPDHGCVKSQSFRPKIRLQATLAKPNLTNRAKTNANKTFQKYFAMSHHRDPKCSQKVYPENTAEKRAYCQDSQSSRYVQSIRIKLNRQKDQDINKRNPTRFYLNECNSVSVNANIYGCQPGPSHQITHVGGV